MSAPIADPRIIVPVAILTASLLGSGHCVAMCGGFTVMFSRSKLSGALYHLGRLFAYAGLGALAGTFGGAVFGTKLFKIVPWLAAFGAAIPLLFLGVLRFRGRPLHLKMPGFFQNLWQKLWPNLSASNPRSALLAGVLSAFLPCGWLYSFVFAAAVTQSALLGAVSLSLFWAGSVPALASSSLVLVKVLKPLGRLAPKFSGALLIAAALFTIGVRAAPLISSLEKRSAAVENQVSENANDCPFHRHD